MTVQYNIDRKNIKSTKCYNYLGILLTRDNRDNNDDVLQKIGRGRILTSKTAFGVTEKVYI